MKNLAEAKGQKLIMDFQEAPIPVKCDPDKFNSAFVNLLDNAVRFTPEDGKITLGVLPGRRGSAGLGEG